MMDRQHIEEQDIIGRYVRGQLPDDELTAFENYSFDHPDVLRSIESERALARGMKSEMENYRASEAQQGKTEPGWRLSPAMAATVLLVVGGLLVSNTVFFNQVRDLSDRVGVLSKPSVTTQAVWLVSNRSASVPEQTVELTVPNAPLLVHADVSAQAGETVSVELSRAADIVFEQDDIVVSDRGNLTIVLTATAAQGEMTLTIRDAGGKPINTYGLLLQ